MNTEDIRVVILAGGKGTRLKPYTTVFPKPLMPIGDMPILEVVLRQLKFLGFAKITLSINHLAELIQVFFGAGEKLGLEISYCQEDKPLGTAGSISLVEDLSEYFLVMNGDLLTTIDYSKMVQSHIQSAAAATIGVFPREVKIDFGVLDIEEDGKLLDYREKPRFEFLVSMGVNAFHKSVLDFIPEKTVSGYSNSHDEFEKIREKVMTFRSECEWLDIGRPDDYEKAAELFERSKHNYLREE